MGAVGTYLPGEPGHMVSTGLRDERMTTYLAIRCGGGTGVVHQPGTVGEHNRVPDTYKDITNKLQQIYAAEFLHGMVDLKHRKF